MQANATSPGVTAVWIDGSGSQMWSDNLNWNTGVVPGPTTAVQIGTQPTGDQIGIDTGVTVASFTFNNTLPNTVDIAPTGLQTLQVNGAIINNSAFTDSFSLPVIAGASAAWTGPLNFTSGVNIGSNTITLSGAVSFSSLTFDINSASSYGRIAGSGAVAIGDTLIFNFTSAAGSGTWDFFNQTPDASSLTSIILGGFYAGSFTQITPGNWAATIGGVDWTYKAITGVLTATGPEGTPPAITSQPVSAVVTNGQSVSLSVSNSGTAPFGYQWMKDGVILAGQTNSTLSLSSFKFTDSGSYSVVITNAQGMTISLPASLSTPNAPLQVWGYNSNGQLGNGTTNNSLIPITVASNVAAAVGGQYHSLFVKADGTLWAMGHNGFGQLGNGTTIDTNLPIQVASNVAGAGGYFHSLFVKADGTLWGMGRNNYGQLGNGTTNNTSLPVQVADNVVSVAGGSYHSLFVKADGTLWAMGYNFYGQLGNGTTSKATLPVQVASNVVSVACGGYHSLFVKADGTLWGMGLNVDGQLGNGAWINTNRPIQMASNVVAAAAGVGHSLFVKTDGTLWAMGYNNSGQLGNGTTNHVNLPVQVASNVVSAAGGQYHSLFVEADGTLWAMGDNSYGELGNGTTNNASLPVQVNGLLTATLAKEPTAWHSLAIALSVVMTDQTISFPAISDKLSTDTVGLTATASSGLPVSFSVLSGSASITGGTNLTFTGAGSVSIVASQAGDSTYNAAPSVTNTFNVTTPLPTPPSISSQPVSAVVTVGGAASLSVSNSGTGPFGYQWIKDGAILSGQTNSTLSFSSFKFTDSGSYSVVITNSGGMTISLPASLSVPNATLQAWGQNTTGQLGNGMTTDTNRPITVASNVVSAAGGSYHSLFVKADGTLWGMGGNGSGQLGNGTTVDTNRPVQVASNVVAAAGGSYHSLFVKADGTLWAMGDNTYGQLGNGTLGNYTNRPITVASNVVSAAVGAYYSLFVKADGTLWAMGQNNSGQLGNGTTNDISLPVQVASNVVSAAGGSYHSLFVKADGTLWAMGRNTSGQLGNGTNTDTNRPVQVMSNVTAAVCGNIHSLFVKADGTLWGMGGNSSGPLGNGTKTSTNLPTRVMTSNVVAVAGGFAHSLFVKADGTLWGMGWNQYGQLADDMTNNLSTVPFKVTGLLTASLAKEPRAYFSLAIALSVALTDQTITFPAISDKLSTDTVGLSATASSGLPVTFTTNGGPAIITGGTNLSFTGAGSVSIVASQAGDSTYNAAPSVTNTFNVTTPPTPPSISSQPVSAVVTTGSVVSLSVSNNGTAPFGYQWIKDGVILTGQTNSTLSFNSFKFTDSGSYSVVITNSGGMTISMPANLSTPNASLQVWGNNYYGQLGNGTMDGTNRPITVASNVVAAAGGQGHSLFVKADGTLWAMGQNGNGQLGNGTWDSTTLPILVASNVVAVAGGTTHSLFVKADGTLWGMGYNTYGQLGNSTTSYSLTPVQVASNVVAAAGGSDHSLFVKADGTLWAVGRNTYGQLGNGTTDNTNRPVQVASNVVAAASGENHSLFVKADGTLWAMGQNGLGQLGNGKSTDATRPVQVASNVVAAASGEYHSLFVKTDGTLWVMGLNIHGQLGNGTMDGTNRPVQVASNVVAAAGGVGHSLFVKTDGTLWVTGDNFYGELGNGTTNDASLPVQVVGLQVASLAKGSEATHSLAISLSAVMTDQTITFPAISDKLSTDTVGLTATASSGLPVSFSVLSGSASITGGTNLTFSGAGSVSIVASQAGDSTYNAAPNVTNTFNVTTPPPSISSQPVSAVVTNGQAVSLSVSNNGTAPFGYQWIKDGVILSGQTNSTLSFNSFKFTDSGSYSVVITNAQGMTISLPANLSVSNAPLQVWGYNNFGQLGNGATSNSLTPITVASNVTAAAGGGYHSLFVKADGTLWAMGYNGDGELGNGTYTGATLPVQVASNVVAAAGGQQHSLFVKADGTLWAMGANISGQLGNGTTSNTNRPVQVASNVVAAACGNYHSLFVKADGTLWVMGYNNNGQLGNGTTANTNLPVQVASNVVAAACGAGHSLFVKADGTLWAMGDNYYGQLGNGKYTGATLPVQVASNVVAAAGGYYHSLFVKGDGTLWAMGNNTYGQLGNGTYAGANLPVWVASNAVAAACGQYHSLFVKADGTLWAMGQNTYGQLGNGTPANTNRPIQVTGLMAASLAKESLAYHTLAITFSVMTDQTITFPAISDKLMTDTVGLAATASSGLPVSFSVLSGLASISGGTNLTFTGTGTVSIVASQAGDSSYNAAPSVTNTFNVTAPPTPPSISSQPVSAVMTVGGAASLSVSNSGTGPFGYQWIKDGVILASQTNSTLSFSSFKFTDSGSYSVVITNAGGMTISLPASLSVSNAPLQVWGYNNFGQLGNGTTTDTNRPITVASNVVAVSGGSYHTLLAKADGTLWAMGWNNNGQLGNGTTTDTNQPVLVASNVVAVAASEAYSLFVKADGTLWGMGRNSSGQLGNGTTDDTNRPIWVASNVAAVAVGTFHSLFVKTDGTLWSMGDNWCGQLGNGNYDGTNRPVFVASNVVGVAAGYVQSLFMKVDGTLWGMGRNEYGQLGLGAMYITNKPTLVASNVAGVSAGFIHSLFVKADGTLWGMGDNEYGQLGDGTKNNASLPIQVASNVVAAAGGSGYSLFVKADNILWAMGANNCGQLGDGTLNNSAVPIRVNLLTASLAQGSSENHPMAIAGALPAVSVSNQTVTVGQTTNFTAAVTGDGPFTYQWQFGGTNIVNATNAVYTIASAALSDAGSYAVIVVSPYGSTTSAVSTLTVNKANQTITFPAISDKLTTDTVGLTATASSGLPVSFSVLSGSASITGGTNLTFSGAGSVSIVASQTGNGSYNAAPSVTNTFSVTAASSSPVITVQPVSAVVTIGSAASLSVSNNGTGPFSYQWLKDGVILTGQTNRTVSFGSFNYTDAGNYSVVITNALGMVISSPANLSVTNAALWAWGNDYWGQLFDGRSKSGNIRSPISVLSNVVSVSAGYWHSLLAQADGTLWTVGYNAFGQLGNGTTVDTNRPVQVASNVVAAAGGYTHSLFVKADGTLWAMGDNGSGQLGNGTYLSASLPVPVASNVVAFVAGDLHSLFVKTDGTLWAMGNNGSGQLGNGTTAPANLPVPVTSNVVAIAGGSYHSLFVKADGTLWAMGDNRHGQLGNGTTSPANLPVPVTSNVVAIAGGSYHSLFVKADGTLWAMGYNRYGQLGNGTTNDVSLPVQVASNVLAVAAGANHSLFEKTDGTLRAMGYDESGQLGDGTTRTTNLPIVVARGLRAGSLAPMSFADHTFVIAASAVPVLTDQTISFPAISDKVTTNTVGLSATVSSGLPVSFSVLSGSASISGGTNLTFTGAGSVSIVASQAGNVDWSAAPSVTNMFNVTKAFADITLSNTNQIYDGTAKNVAVATVPTNLIVTVRYNGSATVPSNAAVYTVVATVSEAMYQGAATGTLTIAKANQTVSFPSIGDQLTTNIVTLSATASSGLSVTNFSVVSGPALVNGVTLTFTNSGSVTLSAVQAGNTNWIAAPATNITFNVTKAVAGITLNNTNQTYDGTAKSVMSITAPSNLAMIVTYDGGATVPSNAASYTVVATVNEAMYQGSATGTLTIAKANQTVNFPNIGNQLTTNVVTLSATASSGLTVTNFSVVSGPAVVSGSSVSFTNSGAVLLSAIQNGNTNYNASAATNISFSVTKALASVNLSGTNQTYDGTAKSVTVTTVPTNLSVSVTYDGGATVPSNAASHTAVATVNEAMYQGGATGTLTIAKASQTVSFPNIGNQLTTNVVTLSATASSGLTVTNFSVVSGPAVVSGSSVSFTNGGAVVLSAVQNGNTNYNASAATNISFSVSKAVASVTLSNTNQTYDGTAKSVTVTTVPVGRTVSVTYDSSATVPSNAASYTVVATVNEAMYQGGATGTLTIAKASQTVTFPNIGNQLTTNVVTLSATATSGLGVTNFSVVSGPALVNGATLTFTNSGNVTLSAVQSGNTNWNASAATNISFSVTKALASVSLSGTNQTYNGSARTVTATTIPSGQTVVITYNGSSTAPTNAGSYTVIGTVNEAIYQGGTTGTLTVAQANQTISFSNPGNQLTTNVVTLSATASSGLTNISFGVVSGPAAVSGNTVSFSAGGTVVLNASQAGNTNWNPASTNISFTVSTVSSLVTYADDAKADDSGNGLSWATAKKTIQAAINLVGDGGTVWVTNGTYSVGSTVTPGYASTTNRVCITRNMTVQSVNGAGVTIIDGLGTLRCVFMNAGTLDGFTLTRGFSPHPSGDFAETSGGGAYLAGGALNNCTLSGNSAALYGGGACIMDGSTLNNCTLSGNSASIGGGGALLIFGMLNNCTLSGNSANYGGGVYLDFSTLNNCIVWGNTAVIDADIRFGTGSGILQYSCAPGILGTGCITNNPLFVSTNDFHLQPGSPCINAGNNSYVTTTNDLAGNPRIAFGTVDMGAYESQIPPITVPVALSAVDITSSQFTARWAATDNATNYLIDVSETNTFTSCTGVYSNRSAGNVSACVVGGLADGVTYYYRVRAANQYGTSTNSNVIAVLVSTNTPYVEYEQTNGVASAGSSDVVDMTKLFHGAGMTYAVVSNSNPTLVSAYFIGLNLILDYAPGVSGTARITVRATDNSTGFWVENTITVSVAPAPSLTLGSITLNRQNGLYEQIATVSNTSPTLAARAVTLTVTNLSAGARLYNATGTDEYGNPEILWVGTLAPLGSMNFTLQYYTAARGTVPSATVLASLSLEGQQVIINGTTFALSATYKNIGGTPAFLIEFPAVPGKTYYIQYTDALTNAWKTAQPKIIAPVDRIQWIDSGPPGTESAPGSVSNRFYRVIEAAQ